MVLAEIPFFRPRFSGFPSPLKPMWPMVLRGRIYPTEAAEVEGHRQMWKTHGETLGKILQMANFFLHIYASETSISLQFLHYLQ